VPSHSADRNGDDLTATPVPTSHAPSTGPVDVTDKAAGVGGAYIYGYDSDGNPTLTDADH
jgi:hypothetical protein